MEDLFFEVVLQWREKGRSETILYTCDNSVDARRFYKALVSSWKEHQAQEQIARYVVRAKLLQFCPVDGRHERSRIDENGKISLYVWKPDKDVREEEE